MPSAESIKKFNQEEDQAFYECFKRAKEIYHRAAATPPPEEMKMFTSEAQATILSTQALCITQVAVTLFKIKRGVVE